MNAITINYKRSEIEITKSFEKEARVYGSDAYRELAKVRKEFPDYELVIKASKGNNTFKGVDYNFIKKYISNHEEAEKHTEEFEALCKNKLSFGEILQWFVKTYPVFKDCKTRAELILATLA